MQSINSGVEKIREVVTILDKEGEKVAYLALNYDKNSTGNIKQIIIFDSNGKKIKNIKQSEITDSPAYSSLDLFSDDRIKYYKPNNPVYPYTVEYEYEVDRKNIISFGCWTPFDAYNVSAQHTRMTFTYPSDIKINKKEINIHGTKSDIKNNKIDLVIGKTYSMSGDGIYLGNTKEYVLKYFYVEKEDEREPTSVLLTFEFDLKDITKGNFSEEYESEFSVRNAKLVDMEILKWKYIE